MVDVGELGRLVWRDWTVDGVPSSGAHLPVKEDIRTFVTAVDQQKGHVFANAAALRLYQGDATTAMVVSRSTFGDGGGGPFTIKPGDTTTVDDGAMIVVDALGRRWWRGNSGSLNVRWFGAKGDGVANDRPAFSAAVAAAAARGGGGVYAPPGTYRFADKLVILASNIVLFGDGRSATWIVGDHQDDIVEIGDGIAAPHFCRISNMRIDGGSAARTITSNHGQPAGAALRFRNGHTIEADHIQFGLNHYTCVQLDGGPTAFIYRLDQLELNAGAYGVRAGALGGSIQDLSISNTVIDQQSVSAIELTHLSGGYFHNISILTCRKGVHANPGDGQYVTACFFNQVLSDTCIENGWLLQPTHPNGSISDWNVCNSWAASNGTGNGQINTRSGLRIGGNGLGTITGLTLDAFRVSNNKGDGIQLLRGTDITFANCHAFCNSQAGDRASHGLSIASGVSNWSVIGGVYGKGGRIGFVTGVNRQGYGIIVNGGASDHYNVVGANVQGNIIAGLSDGGSGSDKNIRDNIGYRNRVEMTVQEGLLTTDGNGDVTISHTLDVVPRRAMVQMNGPSAAYHLQPLSDSFGSATLKIRVYDMAGSPVTDTLLTSSLSFTAAG